MEKLLSIKNLSNTFALFITFFISSFSIETYAEDRPIPENLTAAEEADYARLQCGQEPVGFWATSEQFYDGIIQIYANEALKEVSSVYRVCNMSTDHPMDIMTSSGKTYSSPAFTCLDVRFRKYISVGGHIPKNSDAKRPEIHGHYCKISSHPTRTQK